MIMIKSANHALTDLTIFIISCIFKYNVITPIRYAWGLLIRKVKPQNVCREKAFMYTSYSTYIN